MLTKTKNIYRPGFGKSVAHEQIQYHLKKQIPSIELEKVIGKRRADAVWEEKKIVFEIQLSSIAHAEVLNRCSDYAASGYHIVWILHEGLFNGPKVTPAEKFLRESQTTYFTNGATIYDQIEVISGKRRLFQGTPLPVQIEVPCTPFLTVPNRTWPLHFVGDVHTFCATHGVEEVRQIIKPYETPNGLRWWLQFIGLRILEFVSTNQK
jgi:hypothetical protein